MENDTEKEMRNKHLKTKQTHSIMDALGTGNGRGYTEDPPSNSAICRRKWDPSATNERQVANILADHKNP
jgi:hypothetical protein